MVNTTITLTAATGIILAKDASLLSQNRGELNLSKEWAQRMMRRVGFVKCKTSTGEKVAPEVLKELQKQYISDYGVCGSNRRYSSRSDHQLAQTPVKYAPVSSWI